MQLYFWDSGYRAFTVNVGVPGAIVKSIESLLADSLTALSSAREIVSTTSPQRSEKHYRKFKGDGPARMMAKFRTFQKSQLLIHETDETGFGAVVDTIARALDSAVTLDPSEPEDWESVVRIPFGEDAVFFGISNPYQTRNNRHIYLSSPRPTTRNWPAMSRPEQFLHKYCESPFTPGAMISKR